MNRDFHYDVISILAQTAGFPTDEATLIATASQYTDDCTFYEKIPMNLNLPGQPGPDARYLQWETDLGQAFPQAQFTSFRNYAFEQDFQHFDPICTAHFNLEKRLKSLLGSPVALFRELSRLKNDRAMLKVFVAFHFVPDYDNAAPREKFHVEKNCRFLRDYLQALLGMLGTQPAGSLQRRQVLIALGIALHSFADTWSHAGFSGRWNSQENDIEDLKVARQYGDQEKGIMPDIGHMEAGSWVDRPESDLAFSFEHTIGQRPSRVSRQNPVHFTEAADEIFQILSGGSPFPSALKKFLFDAFRMDLEESERITWLEHRVNVVRHLYDFYPNLQVHPYDRQQWLNEIIPAPADYNNRITYQYKPDADWFLFQTAAMAQRNLIHAFVL
ncbi:hypothetical protein KKC22_09875 [Myxococcota bacterium]|nr:hypothetical protein [Myxococcota bacterium]